MLKFTLSSLDGLPESYLQLATHLGEYKISQEKMFDIRLTMYELCGNILKHSQTQCEIDVDFDGESLKFNLKSDKDFEPCEKMFDLCAESGRGIFLVRQVAESLEYLDSGKNIVAVINILEDNLGDDE